MKFAAIFTTLALALLGACGDSKNKPADAPPAQIDAGAPDASCFTNPTTNEEIINACTDAQKIYKDSHPPLMKADGTLPPLPQ